MKRNMYFLNGDRIYIKPEAGCDSMDSELKSCLGQLKQINSGKKVFKLNFFTSSGSAEDYQRLQGRVRELVSERFTTPVVSAVIAQPPLTCRVIVEAFYYDPELWVSRYFSGETGSAMFLEQEDTQIMIGMMQSCSGESCRKDSEIVFESIRDIMGQLDFQTGTIVRQWNYIEDILGFEGEKQRYQEFNNVRSGFYGNHFDKNGYPAATGIGTNLGGIMIEFVAVRSEQAHSYPIDNPQQVSAHDYSEKVLIGGKCSEKTTPKFERARYLELFGKKMIFISGTASIRGEHTIGIGDPVEQTRVTIENIQGLYSPEVLSGIPDRVLEPRYGHARVYVKRREDFKSIKKTFERYYGRLPVVYILADICRDDLLVEIEGKVVLH